MAGQIVAKLSDLATMAMAWLETRTETEEGQGLVEYALIIALVAVFLIGALTALGGGVDAVLRGISTTLGNNVPAP